MKNYIVYNLQLAHLLANKGFKLVGTGINYNNPKFKVFYFEDTPELHEAVKELKRR